MEAIHVASMRLGRKVGMLAGRFAVKGKIGGYDAMD